MELHRAFGQLVGPLATVVGHHDASALARFFPFSYGFGPRFLLAHLPVSIAHTDLAGGNIGGKHR